MIGLKNERLESWILIPWWECLFLTWDVRLAWSSLGFPGSLQLASGSVHGTSHKRDGFLVEEGNIPGKFCPTAIKKKKKRLSRASSEDLPDMTSGASDLLVSGQICSLGKILEGWKGSTNIYWMSVLYWADGWCGHCSCPHEVSVYKNRKGLVGVSGEMASSAERWSQEPTLGRFRPLH